MALSNLTRQLAEQAILNATNKPAAAQPESLGAALLGQVQAMQKAVKEDEELVVWVHAGGGTLRVVEFFFPSWQVVVVTAVDKDKNVVRVVSAAESLQLICRVVKLPAGAKANRIGLVTPGGK